MAVESAADLAVFFDTGDFGVTASHQLASGWGMTSLNGMFSDPTVGIEPGAAVAFASTAPTFTTTTADLPAGYGPGDILTIDSIAYVWVDHDHDGTGLITILLETQ